MDDMREFIAAVTDNKFSTLDERESSGAEKCTRVDDEALDNVSAPASPAAPTSVVLELNDDHLCRTAPRNDANSECNVLRENEIGACGDELRRDRVDDALKNCTATDEKPSPGSCALDGAADGDRSVALYADVKPPAVDCAPFDSSRANGGSAKCGSPLDAFDEVIGYPTVFPDCINFDKYNYSINFSKHPSKTERNDNLIASDLISSETMSDFFDEMYDMNYVNNCRRRKDDGGGDQMSNSFCGGVGGPAGADDGAGDEYHRYKCAKESASDHRFDLQMRRSAALKSSLKRHFDQRLTAEYVPYKKPKRGITFDSVSVYYFPRTQGFTCIPSQGGSTLGMSWSHSHSRKFSLGEYAAEQRRAHRQLCSQQIAASRNWNELPNASSEDSDSDEIISDSEVDYENYNFLQPIPTRERRAMLRAAGIHKIDSGEKDECRSIRLSREFCGCNCQVHCDPETCVCAQAGIKCQVDRMNFPCSCSREGCANENGRVEFNPVRVRTHYIHTLMRLEMEKKKDEDEERNCLILNSLKNAPQLSYLPPTPSSSGCRTSDLVPFSYHNGSSYYTQPLSYDVSSMASSENQPSFNYGNQFVVSTSNNDSILSYSQLSSVTNFRALGGDPSSLTAEYSMSGECLLVPNCDNSALNQLRNQNFPDVCDAIGPASPTATTYDADSTVRLLDDNLKESVECPGIGESLHSSGEVEKETEKEESDSENFGDIIKKTMVESVIG